MIPPITFARFGMEVVDRLEKRAIDMGDFLTQPAVVGALSGGLLGGMTGDVLTREEENRWRNRVLGILAGATLGGGAAHLLADGGESAPSEAQTAPEGVKPPIRAGSQPKGEASIQAQAVEPALRQTDAAVRRQVQQQAAQQAVQMSTARERAAILRDQGRVSARMQQMMAPAGTPPPAQRLGKYTTTPGAPKITPRLLRSQSGNVYLYRPGVTPGARQTYPAKGGM